MTAAVEIWRPIPGYEREYEASSLGRIRSLRRTITMRHMTRAYGGKELKLVLNSTGRLRVSLSKSGIVRNFEIHILICSAFRGPKPADKDLAAHWDGDHLNNHPDNLRWATILENEDDKRRHGRNLAGARNPSAKLTDDEVAAIRRLRSEGCESLAEIGRRYGVSKSHVSNIALGKCWSDEGNAARRADRLEAAAA